MSIGPWGCFGLGAWFGITMFVLVIVILNYINGGKK